MTRRAQTNEPTNAVELSTDDVQREHWIVKWWLSNWCQV